MIEQIVGGSVSLCTDADLAEVVDFVNAAYRGEGGWTNEIGLVEGLRVTIEALRSEIAAAPDMRIYLFRQPPELLACVRVEDDRGAGDVPACHISMLAVRPGRQDGGMGRRMLEFAESEGRARGARAARMTVVSIRSSLIAWYERRGYHRTGETEPFPSDDVRFGRPQQLGLQFIYLQKELV